MDSGITKSVVLEHFKAGELEVALMQIDESKVRLEKSDYDQIISFLIQEFEQYVSNQQVRSAKRLARIIHSVKSFRTHGLDPSNILEPVILPDGYHGKILLLSVTGGILENNVILRSGDLWHSEILREAQEEIKDLGLINSDAYPLGGAWARFENENSIVIWGTSDQYGTCDKEAVAKLIQTVYWDKDLLIEY
jgi:hypothetical protein